jgi:hypothetical protein
LMILDPRISLTFVLNATTASTAFHSRTLFTMPRMLNAGIKRLKPLEVKPHIDVFHAETVQTAGKEINLK